MGNRKRPQLRTMEKSHNNMVHTRTNNRSSHSPCSQKSIQALTVRQGFHCKDFAPRAYCVRPGCSSWRSSWAQGRTNIETPICVSISELIYIRIIPGHSGEHFRVMSKSHIPPSVRTGCVILPCFRLVPGLYLHGTKSIQGYLAVIK